jgi:hypothetical protein
LKLVDQFRAIARKNRMKYNGAISAPRPFKQIQGL